MGSDIADRLLEVGAAVVRLVRMLSKDYAGRHIGQQLLRAATELREAIFWLTLIQRTELTPVSVSQILSEANQLTAILSASARTARKRLNSDDP